MTARTLPLLLPVLAFGVCATVFLHTMGEAAPRVAGTDSVNPKGLVVQISEGSRVCQPTLLPRDAASVRLFVAPTVGATSPLSMTLLAGGRAVATSHLAAGWTGTRPRFDFPTLSRTVAAGTICIRNEGRTSVRFGGSSAGRPTATTVNGAPERALITVEFFRPGVSDWWSLLPTIAHRAGVLKGSLAGGWGFWLAVALALLAGAIACGVSMRGIGR